MRIIKDSGGQEFTVAEPVDLELFIGRLALRIGMWVAATGLVCSFALGGFLMALRKDVQETGRRIDRIEDNQQQMLTRPSGTVVTQ